MLLAFGSLFSFVQWRILSGFKCTVPKNLDYIIVLGAQVLGNGPGGVLLPRLEKAVECLNKNPKTLCIVTGGQGANEPFPEAKYLVEHKIDETRIVTEGSSLNTTENIKNSAKLANLKNKKVGIVTNNFHVYRATKIAKKCGINNVFGLPCEIHKFCLANNMLREFFGILKDKICKNI